MHDLGRKCKGTGYSQCVLGKARGNYLPTQKSLLAVRWVLGDSITICEALRCAAEGSCRTPFEKSFQSVFVRDAVSTFSLSAGGRVC